MEAQSTAVENKLDTPGEQSVAGEETAVEAAPSGDKSDLQEALPETAREGKQKEATADPRGIPWVDFVPEFTHKHPESLAGRLEEFCEDLGETMQEKEKLRFAAFLQKLHRSYTSMWVSDCNKLFRTIARLHRRYVDLQANAAAEKDK
ncbi:MAG: hypothetical protein HYW48_10505 [Deltaproteobacteria bacterium]|nr:hypothetical protein [Deltaproteobacteria bacterium]